VEETVVADAESGPASDAVSAVHNVNQRIVDGVWTMVMTDGGDDRCRQRPALGERGTEDGVVGAETIALDIAKRSVGCGARPTCGTLVASERVDRELPDVTNERSGKRNVGVDISMLAREAFGNASAADGTAPE